jgi:hypothetical protein
MHRSHSALITCLKVEIFLIFHILFGLFTLKHDDIFDQKCSSEYMSN